jgi:peroxiredoxin
MNKGKVLMLIAGMIAGVILVTWIRSPSFKEIDLKPRHLKEGDPAPDFSLNSVFDGKPISLASFRNSKAVLLYFWASWCPSCLEVRPEVEALRKEIEPEKLEILAINIGAGDSVDSVRKFQKKHPLSVPVLFDKGSSVSQSYGVQGVPFFVLVDTKGIIVYQGNELPRDLKRYLM